MGIFRGKGISAVIMAMLFLVLVFLLLNNFYATNQVTKTVLSNGNQILKTLQGR